MIENNPAKYLKTFVFWLWKPKKYKTTFAFIRLVIYILCFYIILTIGGKYFNTKYTLTISMIVSFVVALILEWWSSTNDTFQSIVIKIGTSAGIIAFAYFVDQSLGAGNVILLTAILICVGLYFVFGPVPPEE